MVSIIIPAYNEEGVIRRTLDSLLKGADPTDLEIIVCCNGCVDRTAEIAMGYGPPVKVLETTKGSKTLALNMGDAAATTFPRIYLDADISLSFDAVQRISRALSGTNILAVAPRMRVDLSDRSWLIRAFHEIWLTTPYHTSGMIGSGVYALSEAGRKRFGDFPDIIADDGFVRAQFAPNERQILDDCEFTVCPPTTFSGLLKIKTRAQLGNKELAQKHSELIRTLSTNEPKGDKWSWLGKFAVRPLLWPKLAVYLGVKAIATVRAKGQLKKLTTYRWERDESSRA